MGNYSFKTTGLPEPIDGVVEGHNFTQGVPNTTIYPGYSELTFRNCNLLNCSVPTGSIIENCLTSQTSFCSHINKGWLENEYIQECAIDCVHVIDYDTITVDGITIETNYIYEDKVV